MRPLAAPFTSAVVLAVAFGCHHDERPANTPVPEVHTTGAPVPGAPQPVIQPNVPSATGGATGGSDDLGPTPTVRDPTAPRSGSGDFSPLAPGHGGTTTPGGQYGSGTPVEEHRPPPTTTTPNGGFDPLRDAEEHRSGVSGAAPANLPNEPTLKADAGAR